MTVELMHFLVNLMEYHIFQTQETLQAFLQETAKGMFKRKKLVSCILKQ